MLATDLELQLVRPEARAAIRRALEAVADRGAARRVAAELDVAGTANGVDWAATTPRLAGSPSQPSR